MTDLSDLAVQRQACRVAMQATIDTLLDLAIPPAVIVESLAAMSVETIKGQTIRVIQARRSNDDSQPGT